MPPFTFDPQLAGADLKSPFLQTVRLSDGGTALGQARWYVADDADGVAQLLSIEVEASARRRRHGRRLMGAVVEQAREYFRLRGRPLRRLWVPVRQKQQILARAFLMANDFYHVGTVQELHAGEDLLIYMRTFN